MKKYTFEQLVEEAERAALEAAHDHGVADADIENFIDNYVGKYMEENKDLLDEEGLRYYLCK